MAAELFQEVAKENFPKVLKALKKDWPKHFLLHQIITVLEEYKRKGSKWEHTLYLCGDYETGIYLNKLYIEFSSGYTNYFTLYTTNLNQTLVERAMQQTQVIPWQTRRFGFIVTPNIFLNAIQEGFATNGLVTEVHSNILYWFPLLQKLNIKQLPDDVYIDFLNGSHAEEMDRNWPHRYPGSELVHREHLEKNFGLGLFRKNDKKMLSSALCNYTGGIFVLYSEPEFRGRGYASFVIQHMVQEIRSRGWVPFCTVIRGNKASEKVFTKAGFEPFTNADYIFPKY